MKFTALKNYVFYPDINGNRGLPEGERLSVEIIRPTAEERGDLAWFEGIPRGTGSEAVVRVRYNAPRILRNNVGAVKNLVVRDAVSKGDEKAVVSGPELAGASFIGMNALVDDICAEVCSDIMTEAQKKISESGSASSGAAGTSGS